MADPTLAEQPTIRAHASTVNHVGAYSMCDVNFVHIAHVLLMLPVEEE
jgi:hypothetical protein